MSGVPGGAEHSPIAAGYHHFHPHYHHLHHTPHTTPIHAPSLLHHHVDYSSAVGGSTNGAPFELRAAPPPPPPPPPAPQQQQRRVPQPLAPDPLGLLNVPMDIGKYLVGHDGVEQQLMDLMGMVLGLQNSLVQYLALIALSTDDSPVVQSARDAAKKLKDDLKEGNRKLRALQNYVAEQRESVDGGGTSDGGGGGGDGGGGKGGGGSRRKTGKRRGRGRLVKCDRHRQWKKKCPDDCPDKPTRGHYRSAHSSAKMVPLAPLQEFC